MNYHGVTGHSNIVRDSNTNSIVNIDRYGYDQYIARRESQNKKNQKIQDVQQEIAIMKEDINEIKQLLREILNGSK